MKQYLLLLAGLMILAPYGQADAKAVKLGRGNAYSVAADANLNTGANDTQLKKENAKQTKNVPATKSAWVINALTSAHSRRPDRA